MKAASSHQLTTKQPWNAQGELKFMYFMHKVVGNFVLQITGDKAYQPF